MKPLFFLFGITFILASCDSNAPHDVVISPTASKIFWTDRRGAEIQSADLNGENVEKLVFGLFSLRNVEINEAEGKIYFNDTSTSRILRSNTDGSDIEFVQELSSWPTEPTLDSKHEKLYWVQDSRIWRSNLDGSMSEMIIEPVNSERFSQLSIDSDTGEMFWIRADQQSNQFWLVKSDLDGNALQELIALSPQQDERIAHIDALRRSIYVQEDRVLQQVHIDSLVKTDLMTLPDGALMLHIDSENNQVYWLQNSEIWRTDLASGAASLFFADSFQFSGLRLTVHRNSVFWVRTGGQEIYQADLDGGNARQVIRVRRPAPSGSANFLDYEITEDGSALFAIYHAGKDARLIRVDLNTRESKTLIAYDARPHYLAADPERDGLYWGDAESHLLNRSRLDGRDPVEVIVAPDIRLPGDMKIDAMSSKVYWIELASFNSEPKIMQSNRDGTAIEQILGESDGLENPGSLALDTEHKKLYWTDRAALAIYAADLDGNNKVTLISDIHEPMGIEVDPSNGKMYWIQSLGQQIQTIRRADLDGTNIEILVDAADDLHRPIDLELDLVQEKLYWTEFETAKIRRANLDGSNVIDLVTSEDGLRGPWNLSIALVQENQ